MAVLAQFAQRASCDRSDVLFLVGLGYTLCQWLAPRRVGTKSFDFTTETPPCVERLGWPHRLDTILPCLQYLLNVTADRTITRSLSTAMVANVRCPLGIDVTILPGISSFFETRGKVH